MRNLEVDVVVVVGDELVINSFHHSLISCDKS